LASENVGEEPFLCFIPEANAGGGREGATGPAGLTRRPRGVASRECQGVYKIWGKEESKSGLRSRKTSGSCVHANKGQGGSQRGGAGDEEDEGVSGATH